MKRIFSLFVALLSVALLSAATRDLPTMFAHRGCWSKNSAGEFVVPENSVAGVAMAARMGYKGIECDVRYTKDGKMVILHDKSINRTMRRASDYSKVEEKIYIKDLTFEQVRRDYVLESADPALRTPIPTLEEILTECKRQGMVPMLHSSIAESYKVAQQMFGNEWIAFTNKFDRLKALREYSDCLILYSINEGSAEQIIAKLKELGGRCGVSTMKHKLYTPQFCKALTDAGYQVQASIFKSPREVIAQRNGVTYQLSDFSIMPSHKPYDKWRTKHAGSKAWSEVKECGATLVEVEYCGAIEVVVNGKRKYKLTRESMGRDIIGNRFFCIAPQVDIRITEGKLRRANVKVFEY